MAVGMFKVKVMVMVMVMVIIWGIELHELHAPFGVGVDVLKGCELFIC